jgi:hypothetical protein
MPPLTIASADAALKQIYKPGYIADVCYKDRPLLAMLPKFEGFGGRNMPIVLEYGHPAGRSQVFATAQANATQGLFEDFLLTRVHDYGVTQIDGETADAMESDRYSWVRGMSNQIDGIMSQTARNLHIMCYGGSNGNRGVVAGGAGTPTLTLATLSDIHKFEVGMSIDGTATGLAGAPFGFPQTITAINRIAGTLTAAANWNAAFVATAELFVEGDYTAAASTNMISGLEAWVPAVVPAAAFFGVVRTQDATRLGGLRQAAFGGTVEESLIRGAFLVDANGGKPSHVFLNPINYRDLVNGLGAKVNYERVQTPHIGMDGVIGFKSVCIDGPKGPIYCISDNVCPEDTAWMLQLDTWVLASLGPAPKLINTRDGNRFLRQNAADGYEVRVGYYGNMGCRAPGYNCGILL